MKTLFEILPSKTDASNNTLILELGDSLVSAILKDEDTNTYTAVALYEMENADKKQISAVLKQLFETKQIFNHPINNFRIVSSFHHSVLIPFSLSEKDQFAGMVDIIHGDLFSSKEVYTDLINEEGIYNAYKMPDAVGRIVKEKFSDYKISHLYTNLLKTISKAEDNMHVTFYPGKIVVVIVKDGKFLLANSFNYDTPETVSYCLVNICHQLDLINIPLKISGLIEEKSVLYKEVYKYFSVVTFSDIPQNCNLSEEIASFPAHYFSNLFAFGLCE